MTRREELTQKLRQLYNKSARAIHIEAIKHYEAEISRLEHELATIMD